MTRMDETMTKARALVALVVTLMVACTAVATGAQRTDRDLGYTRHGFEHDLEAIHDAGITGVLGEVRGPRGRLLARAGVADLHAAPGPVRSIVSNREHYEDVRGHGSPSTRWRGPSLA